MGYCVVYVVDVEEGVRTTSTFFDESVSTTKTYSKPASEEPEITSLSCAFCYNWMPRWMCSTNEKVYI